MCRHSVVLMEYDLATEKSELEDCDSNSDILFSAIPSNECGQYVSEVMINPGSS